MCIVLDVKLLLKRHAEAPQNITSSSAEAKLVAMVMDGLQRMGVTAKLYNQSLNVSGFEGVQSITARIEDGNSGFCIKA